MNTPNDPQKHFVVDVMLGKLAKWLRFLGFRTRIAPLTERSHIESLTADGFIPVTRAQKFQNIEGLVFIRSNDSFEQLKELLSALNIGPKDIQPFTICSRCNSELQHIPRNAVFGSVPDFVFETAMDFRQCPECLNIYWQGSHKGRMLEKLRAVLGWKLNEAEDESGGK
jgi:uncharacterized protein